MTYVSAGLFTINISSLYPDYSSVSISDIIVSPKYLNLNSQGERHTITFTSCSYDASSGVISVNYSGNARIYGSCSADVYIKSASSGGGATTNYAVTTLNTTGAQSSPINVKAGNSITIANGYRRIRYYKNGGSTYTTFMPSTELESDGDFMFLGGHNYGCAFLCLQDATYVFQNPISSEYGAQIYTYPLN